jgi:hypothetical protein
MIEVIEPVPIDDVFCTDLVRVERIGPCLRLSFATPQKGFGIGEDAASYKVIVARLVVPEGDTTTVARMLLEGPPQETRLTHRSKVHPVN